MALSLALPISCAASENASANDSITVYVFLSETCPICQTLTLEIKKVYETYHDKGISFIGLFPNQRTSDKAAVRKFGKKYSIPFELKMDEHHEAVTQFSATVTPQIFVVRNADSKVLYKGKADNHFEAIGQRRDVVTEHYLQNALSNLLNNQPINPVETEAVGCFIQK